MPPPHCSSPESVEEVESNSVPNSFANTINPLMSFTQEEIEFMDKEVEEDMEDIDAGFDVDDAEEYDKKPDHQSSDSESSMTNGKFVRENTIFYS